MTWVEAQASHSEVNLTKNETMEKINYKYDIFWTSVSRPHLQSGFADDGTKEIQVPKETIPRTPPERERTISKYHIHCTDPPSLLDVKNTKVPSDTTPRVPPDRQRTISKYHIHCTDPSEPPSLIPKAAKVPKETVPRTPPERQRKICQYHIRCVQDLYSSTDLPQKIQKPEKIRTKLTVRAPSKVSNVKLHSKKSNAPLKKPRAKVPLRKPVKVVSKQSKLSSKKPKESPKKVKGQLKKSKGSSKKTKGPPKKTKGPSKKGKRSSKKRKSKKKRSSLDAGTQAILLEEKDEPEKQVQGTNTVKNTEDLSQQYSPFDIVREQTSSCTCVKDIDKDKHGPCEIIFKNSMCGNYKKSSQYKMKVGKKELQLFLLRLCDKPELSAVFRKVLGLYKLLDLEKDNSGDTLKRKEQKETRRTSRKNNITWSERLSENSPTRSCACNPQSSKSITTKPKYSSGSYTPYKSVFDQLNKSVKFSIEANVSNSSYCCSCSCSSCAKMCPCSECQNYDNTYYNSTHSKNYQNSISDDCCCCCSCSSCALYSSAYTQSEMISQNLKSLGRDLSEYCSENYKSVMKAYNELAEICAKRIEPLTSGVTVCSRCDDRTLYNFPSLPADLEVSNWEETEKIPSQCPCELEHCDVHRLLEELVELADVGIYKLTMAEEKIDEAILKERLKI